MTYRYSIVLAVAALVAGCSGGGGDSKPAASGDSSGASSGATTPVATSPAGLPPGTIASLENSGVLPKLDHSADVKGPDSDNNGIRDDIDAVLAAKNLEAPKLQAAKQTAKAYQSALTVNVADATALRASTTQSVNAINCMASRFGESFGQLTSEIETYTVNTIQRIHAYDAYNKAQSGSVTSLPEGDTCE